MALIIDTYNLVHAGAAMGGAFAGLNVRRLCQWLVQAPNKQKTTLVLDGRPKPDEPSPNEFPELSFDYSGAGISADKVIGQIIERSKNRRNLTVVTNDRAVAEHARRTYANAIGCEGFLNSLLGNSGRAAAKGKHPEQKIGGTRSPGETEHWLKEFGIDAPVEPPKPRPASDEEAIDQLDMDELMGGNP